MSELSLTDEQILDDWLTAMAEALRQRGCCWSYGGDRLSDGTHQLSYDVDDISKWSREGENFYERWALPGAFQIVDSMMAKSVEFHGLRGGFSPRILIKRSGDISMRLFVALDAVSELAPARVDVRFTPLPAVSPVAI